MDQLSLFGFAVRQWHFITSLLSGASLRYWFRMTPAWLPLCSSYGMAAASPSNSYAATLIIDIAKKGPVRSMGSSSPDGWLVRTIVMSKKTAITSAQIRAARGLLNWAARELSERSGVSQSSIHRAERAKGRPSMHETSLLAIKETLERYGVEFLEDSGVRLGPGQVSDGQTGATAILRKSDMGTRPQCAPGGYWRMDRRS